MDGKYVVLPSDLFAGLETKMMFKARRFTLFDTYEEALRERDYLIENTQLQWYIKRIA